MYIPLIKQKKPLIHRTKDSWYHLYSYSFHKTIPLRVLTNTIALTGEPDIHLQTLMYTTPRPSSPIISMFLFTIQNSLRMTPLVTLLFFVFVFYIVTYHFSVSIAKCIFCIFYLILLSALSFTQMETEPSFTGN